jgi:hypothetical protein
MYVKPDVPLTLYPRRGGRDISDPPRHPNFINLAMRNIEDVTGSKPIAVRLQSNSKSAVNPLVAFYGIHRRKRKVLFHYSVHDATRDL